MCSFFPSPLSYHNLLLQTSGFGEYLFDEQNNVIIYKNNNYNLFIMIKILAMYEKSNAHFIDFDRENIIKFIWQIIKECDTIEIHKNGEEM